MKALVLEEFGAPLRLRTVPTPAPGPEEVLVRVRACAVDHLDVSIRDGQRPDVQLPLILGHEVAGEVAALGRGADAAGAVGVGDRVAMTLYLTCGRCRRCLTGRETICEQFGGYIGGKRPGGYAEYVVVPAANLVRLPDSVSFAEGSVLANAIGTPFHALVKRMDLGPGERVVITGAGGGVGLHAVQIATLVGAHVLAVDMTRAKLDAATGWGADETVDTATGDLRAAIADWTGGRGADAVLELVGPATMRDTLPSLAKGGRMVVVGSQTGRAFTLDPMQLFANEWAVLGSRNCTKADLREVVDLVASGRLHPIVTGRFALEAVEQAHERQRDHVVIGREVLEP
jgi:propanol-preferring alcohol dehydrogenase